MAWGGVFAPNLCSTTPTPISYASCPCATQAVCGCAKRRSQCTGLALALSFNALMSPPPVPLQEMLGLCYILAPDPATDPLKYFNRAMESYPRAAAAGAGGRTGRMLATRCAMTAAAYHAAGGR